MLRSLEVNQSDYEANSELASKLANLSYGYLDDPLGSAYY